MTSDSIIKRTDYCGNLIYGQGRPKMLLVDGKVGGKTEEFVKAWNLKQRKEVVRKKDKDKAKLNESLSNQIGF